VNKGRGWIAAAGAATLLTGLSGFYRVSWHAMGPVMSWPWSQLGRATGIDGRRYGPLAFAVHEHAVVVADTYQQRLVWFKQGSRRHTLPATSMMVEDIALTPAGAPLVADNRNLEVWVWRHAQWHALVRVPRRRGYAQAIWQIAAQPTGVYVELVRLGQGTLGTELNVYNWQGRQVATVTQAEARPSRLATHSLSATAFVKAFVVAANGTIYVEPPAPGERQAVVRRYNDHGQFLSQVTIRLPVNARHVELFGVHHDIIDLGVNLTRGRHAYLVAANAEGRVLAVAPVHAVPIYAAVYGRIGANGRVYLDQSTAKDYIIDKWVLQKRQVWRWQWFGAWRHRGD
jgi:hypothetical protein